MKTENILGMIVGYYLSRFDEDAYRNLGFTTKRQAHLDIGHRLGGKPNSLKNWRDEFEPVHANPRVGWYQRDLQPSRRRVVEALQDLSELEMREVILEILSGQSFLDSDECSVMLAALRPRAKRSSRRPRAYIMRGPTGRRAEEYFVEFHRRTGKPEAGRLRDTRDLGCGYDFAIERKDEQYFVEVKGIASEAGGIVFTGKEWETAQKHGDRYCLVVVSRLATEPELQVIRNPCARLDAKSNVVTTVQVQWIVSDSELRQRFEGV